MPFAFGQRVNLSQQNDRTGITPIKWGFCADDPLTGGLSSYDRGGGVMTSALMHVAGRGVGCGSDADPAVVDGGTLGFIYDGDACCIGLFSKVTPRSSGNNINSTSDGSYTPPSFIEEFWRNIEVPPNAKKVKFYIQTRPGPPKNVIHNTISDCQQSSDCYVAAGKGQCDDCGNFKGGNNELTCGDGCDNSCACCAMRAQAGGSAGNYIVTVDLAGCTQEPLYCYTAWFNGEGEYLNPATGNGATFGTTARCQDNIKVALFPRLPGNPPYPYMDMTDPYAMVTAYKGSNAYEFFNDRTSHYLCECSGSAGGSPCETCDPSVCLPCATCIPSQAIGGNSTISTFEKDSGISINVESTGATAFWGPNGNDGIWNNVFGWNNDSNDGDVNFISSNFGGTGGTACIVNGRDVNLLCGSTQGVTFDYADAGLPGNACACVSQAEPGGQIIGYVVE